MVNQKTNEQGLPLKENGQVDWLEATRLAKLNPPAASPQELAQQLLQLAAAERERVRVLTKDGTDLAPLAAECDARSSSERRAAEERGKAATAAESKRLSDAIAARQAEMASNPTTIIDREVAARKAYDDAMAAIAERAAQPVKMTESELQAAHARKTELLDRYTKARDASLKPNVDVGKF